MFLTPEGCGVGNDEGAMGYGTLNGWTLGDDDTGDGTGNIDLMLSGQSWSITNTGGYTHLALALKQARSFAFYVLDLSKDLSGTWGTLGSNGQGQQVNGFSHINAWYKGDGTPPPPPPPSNVPLPAAAWMLLAALGSLVVFRKKSA
nr:VPLPA-CTERM sorting domain-containing protein [Roseovarius sp. W115]